MGLDLRQKREILKNKEQIFRSCFVKFVNPDKKSKGHLSAIKFENYNALYDEIQRYCRSLFDEIWEQKFSTANIHEQFHEFRILKYTDFDIETKLTSNFKCACITNVCGILNSFVKGHNFSLTKNYEEFIIKKSSKPQIKGFNIQFAWSDIEIGDDLCFAQISGCGEFGIKKEAYRKIVKCKDGQNRCITKQEYVLRLPFKLSKYHRDKFKDFEMCSLTLCKDGIMLNFSKLIPKRLDQKQNKKSKEFHEGQVGCDQGINSVITLAYKDLNGNVNSFQPPLKDKQGWTLAKIIKRMKRCKKGSKQYARYQKLRANFIRWSINQAKQFIKENNVKVIALEDIRFLGKGKNIGGFLSKFEHSLIRSKLNMLCEDCGASLLLQSNAYRSQRCSVCGFVHKLNRKKGTKQFVCINCGNTIDADLNAALNHSVNLEPKKFGQIDNENGEFWKELGSQLGVDLVPNDPEPLIYVQLCV